MAHSLQLVAFTAALGLGLSGGAVLAAPQNAGTVDQAATKVGDAASDTWITTKVKAELATTEGVKSTDISVDTKNGVVTLTGVLPTKIAVKKAVATAKSIKGVTDVDSSGLKVK